jgi:ribosomal protein L37AE/L43A
MPSDVGIRVSFKLHYRCHNCERNVFKRLDVPDVDDAPGDVEELVESAFLQQQRYFCDGCESFIGTLVAITEWRCEEIAA